MFDMSMLVYMVCWTHIDAVTPSMTYGAIYNHMYVHVGELFHLQYSKNRFVHESCADIYDYISYNSDFS